MVVLSKRMSLRWDYLGTMARNSNPARDKEAQSRSNSTQQLRIHISATVAQQ